MTHTALTRWTCLLATAALSTVHPANLSAQGFRWPDQPENIKALPPSVVGVRLGAVMRGYTSALGVRCEYCHVGEGDLANFDFVSDEKLTKEKARLMIKMVQAINGTHLEGLTSLGVPEDRRVEVSCATCHHGQTRPVELRDILTATIDSAGLDAAIDQYRELREQYYGGYGLDFSSRTLIGLGESHAQRGQFDVGIGLLQLEIEMNGESANAYFALGPIQGRAGQAEAGIQSLERGMALAPSTMKRFFQAEIDRIRNR